MPRLSASTLANFFIVALLIATAFGSVTLFLSRPARATIAIHPPQPTSTLPPTATSAPMPTPVPLPVVVYVTGAVSQPGTLLELPHGSRVSDAIAAVGGFASNADRASVNLAGKLNDGDQVHVSALADGERFVTATPSRGVRLRVNSADSETLQTLPGVGPTMARRILDYRDANGPFADLDAMDAVPGVGPATLDKWRGLIAFD